MDKKARDKVIVCKMIELYYRKKDLANECEELKLYAIKRIDACPHRNKSFFCSSCETPCYNPEMRDKIRNVMRYSGPRMLFKHPIMSIKHALSIFL